MFDPFQLVTTPVKSSPTLTPPIPYKEEVPLISPTIPPNPKLDTKSLFQTGYDQVRSTEIRNAPLYLYGTKEEKRYSNPYLQFKPDVIGAYDIEDLYANFQGTGEKFLNALIKTGGTASTSFISSFTSFGNQIDSIRSGKLFDENSTLGQTQLWLQELEDKYPNYYTQWEREHPFKSAIPFSGGFTNFLFDKVIKNAGFTIGSLASGVLVDAGIDILSGGVGIPGSFVLLANQINRAISPLKKAYRNLVKASVTRSVDDVVGLGRIAGGINAGLETAAKASNIKKGLQFAATTYFAAQGEAMIEGWQNYYQTKSDLIKRAEERGTLERDLNDIEDIAQKSAKITTIFNIPVIAASNLLQFSNILSGKNIVKAFELPFLRIINNEGLTIVNNYTRKKAYLNIAKEIGKDFIAEGAEEGFQYYIGTATHDYFLDQFNNSSKKAMGQFMFDQIPKTLEDQQFWENYFIGGITGGLMGMYHSIRKNLGRKEDQVIERLKPVFENFNKSVSQLTHLAENVEFTHNAESLNQFYSAHKSLFHTVQSSLKNGVYDSYLDSLHDLQALPYDEYNKLFGTEFKDDIDKGLAVNALIRESEQIKKEVTNTAKFYEKNPFESSYAVKRIKDIFKVDDLQAKEIQAHLFEQFKELSAYNVSRLRNINAWVVDTEEELKLRGLDTSILPIFRILGTEKAKNEYLRLKNLQLDSLKQELDYQKDLGNETEITIVRNKINQIEKLIPNIKKTQDEDILYQLILEEEISKEQYEKEISLKQARDLNTNEKVRENISRDIEQQVNQPEESAKEMIETLDEMKPEETQEVAQEERLLSTVPLPVEDIEESRKIVPPDLSDSEIVLLDIWQEIGNQQGRDAIEEGWAESFQYLQEALSVGGDKYQAHGMGKSSFGTALYDLLRLFNRGIDPSRGGGQLYTAPLVSSESNTGAGMGTASGNAYMDGAFVLVAKKGVLEIKDISDIGGILVNSGLTDIRPEIVDHLREVYPSLEIESYKNAKRLVENLNKKSKSKPKKITQQKSEELSEKLEQKVEPVIQPITPEITDEAITFEEPSEKTEKDYIRTDIFINEYGEKRDDGSFEILKDINGNTFYSLRLDNRDMLFSMIDSLKNQFYLKGIGKPKTGEETIIPGKLSSRDTGLWRFESKGEIIWGKQIKKVESIETPEQTEPVKEEKKLNFKEPNQSILDNKVSLAWYLFSFIAAGHPNYIGNMGAGAKLLINMGDVNNLLDVLTMSVPTRLTLNGVDTYPIIEQGKWRVEGYVNGHKASIFIDALQKGIQSIETVSVKGERKTVWTRTSEVSKISPEQTEPAKEEKKLNFKEQLQKLQTVNLSNLDQFLPESSLLKEVIGWKLNKGIIIEC